MLNALKGFLLGVVDKLNVAADPFDEFRRPSHEVDPAPLDVRARVAWKDIQDKWLFGPDREFYWSMKPNDLGDMAIWHGLYSATCALMEDSEAHERAVRGMEKLQFLGGNSRLARGADYFEGQHRIDPSRTYWRDGDYVWVDNCSESSLLGHLFGLMFTIGTPMEERGMKMAVALAEQIKADGCRLLNQDGTPAKFGDLRPSLTAAPIRVSALACAYALAAQKDDRWWPEYEKLANAQMESLTHPETHLLFVYPWYQTLIAYISLCILFNCDNNPKRRAKFGDALAGLWKKTRKEGNSFYAGIVAMCNGSRSLGADALGAVKTLREFNITVDSGLKRPGRVDLTQSKEFPSFTWGFGQKKMLVARQPIPVWKRPPQDIVWQRCPYSVLGEDHYDFNYMDFVLAYKLCERYGVLRP